MVFDSNEILSGRLWIGGFPSPEDIERLKRWKIDTVISLQSDEDLSYYGISTDSLKAACSASGISYCRVPIRATISDWSNGPATDHSNRCLKRTRDLIALLSACGPATKATWSALLDPCPKFNSWVHQVTCLHNPKA